MTLGPYSSASFGYIIATDAVDGHRVAGSVGRVVAEGTEGEGVLVHVAGVAEKGLDEVAGADVVQQVAEEVAAERVVAEVLDDAAAVGVRPGLEELFRRGAGKPRQQERP